MDGLTDRQLDGRGERRDDGKKEIRKKGKKKQETDRLIHGLIDRLLGRKMDRQTADWEWVHSKGAGWEEGRKLARVPPYTPFSMLSVKGPSQPPVCFCLRARVWLLYFIRGLKKRMKSLWNYCR